MIYLFIYFKKLDLVVENVEMIRQSCSATVCTATGRARERMSEGERREGCCEKRFQIVSSCRYNSPLWWKEAGTQRKLHFNAPG